MAPETNDGATAAPVRVSTNRKTIKMKYVYSYGLFFHETNAENYKDQTLIHLPINPA
jgi:hypothetical protein